jgi:predicted dehydrogenase
MTGISTRGKLIVGALGAGQIVREQHFPVLAALQQVQLAWVADIDQKAAGALAQVYNCPALNANEVSDDRLNEIDILLVAVPFGARAAYYNRLETGFSNLSLFIEKPLAKIALEHRRIANLRPHHRVACDYFRRVNRVVRQVKLMMAEGFWGKLRECSFGIGGVGGYSVGDKYYADPAIAGGGLLMEIGVHCLDAVLFCSGGAPVGEVAGKMITDNGIDIHTQCAARLRLGDGSDVPFNFVVSMLRETSGCLQFVFDQHTLSFSLFDDRGAEIRRNGGKSGYKIVDDAAPLSGRQTLACFWLRYLEGLTGGVPNETSAVSSLGVTQLVEAAYQLTAASTVGIPDENAVANALSQ